MGEAAKAQGEIFIALKRNLTEITYNISQIRRYLTGQESETYVMPEMPERSKKNWEILNSSTLKFTDPRVISSEGDKGVVLFLPEEGLIKTLKYQRGTIEGYQTDILVVVTTNNLVFAFTPYKEASEHCHCYQQVGQSLNKLY